ncbi:UNVERIFIED_CONTAM: hypothetical protein Sindi_0930700 [Sesamum indicum]
MSESADFHTNATPMFVGTRLKENPGRNPKRVPENIPWIDWDNTPKDTKASIFVGDQLGRLIKIHFIRDGYFEGSRAEKAREYAQALFSLELRKMLIQSYKVPEGQLDSVARRMSFLKESLKDWCYQVLIQKNMKRLRTKIKLTPLCCDNNDFSTIKGESSKQRKRRKQIVTPNPRVPEEAFLDGEHGGPSPKLEHMNLDREQDQQGFHPKDVDEQMPDPLEEPYKKNF